MKIYDTLGLNPKVDIPSSFANYQGIRDRIIDLDFYILLSLSSRVKLLKIFLKCVKGKVIE